MKPLSQDFKKSVPRLKEIINRLKMHDGIGWVDLDPLLKELRVYLKYVYAPNNDLHGLAIPDNGAGWNSIFINSADPIERQRESIGHESFHIFENESGRPHLHWRCGINSSQEFECKCAAAIFYVPITDLIEMVLSDLRTEQIAGELKVPVELVELRWQIAVQFEKYKDAF